MSFYVTDGTNTILAFRCGTKVVVGDKVKVTGKVTAYNGVNQLAQGCTAEILTAEEPEVPTHEHVACPECGKCTAEDCTGAEEEKCAGHEAVKVEYTIPEAIAAADGTAVVVKGKVKSVDIEWSTQYSNMSVTLVDEQGNTLYIFRLATLVALYDEVTITGTVGSYNGAKQIAAGATAEITKVHEHEYVEGVCECGTKDPNYVPDVTVEYELLTTVGFESYTSNTTAKASVEENGITFTTNSVNKMYTDNTPGSVSLKFNNSSSSNAGFEATGFAQAISKITFKAATWNSNATLTFVGTTADGQTITQTVTVSNTAKAFASEEFEVVFETPVVSFTFAASKRAFIDDISFYTVAAQEAPHEHVFVEGKCECGEEDPNYVPPHVHVECPECGKCTAEDCTGAEEEKCAGHEAVKVEYTIPEAIAAADGTAVVVKGKVKSVDIEWSTQYSNMSVTLVDEQGNTLYIFRLATLVALYDEVTITGTVGSYNGAKQIAAGATAEITKVHEHEYVEGVCECGTKDPNYVPDVTVEYELLTTVGFESYTSNTTAKASVEENGITFTTNSVNKMYTDNTPGSVSLKFNNSSSSNAGFEATGFAQAISKITFKAATWNSNATLTFVGTTADGQTITQTVTVSNTAKAFASEEFEVVFETPVVSFTFAASKRAFIDDISFYTVAE